MLPSVGDPVWVRFLDGEPEKPIWEWGMQTLADSGTLAIHEYGNGTPVGAPDRAIFTRYGHSVAITQTAVTVTTAEGYQLLLDTSGGETGGSAALNTPAGQNITLSDARGSAVMQGLRSSVISASNVILNAGTNAMVRASKSFSVLVGSTLLKIGGGKVILSTSTGASAIIDDSGNIALLSAGGASVSVENTGVQVVSPDGTGIVIADGKLSVQSGQVVFNTAAFAVGTDAKYPLVMMTPSLLAWLIGHTHPTETGDSGPPNPSPDIDFPASAASTRMRTT